MRIDAHEDPRSNRTPVVVVERAVPEHLTAVVKICTVAGFEPSGLAGRVHNLDDCQSFCNLDLCVKSERHAVWARLP